MILVDIVKVLVPTPSLYIQVCYTITYFSHLFFINDSLIFYKSYVEEMTRLNGILNMCERVFGQMVKYQKDIVFF